MRAKTYESIGLRSAYLLAARVAGERPLPPLGFAASEFSQKEIEETLQASRYFEAANIARAACYSPHLWFFWTGGHAMALGYTGLLLVLHALCVLVERYKRRLCLDHLSRPESLTAGGLAKPPTQHHEGWADIYFRPKRFETDRLYQVIGMGAFRKFVQWVMKTLTYGFGKGEYEYIPNPTRASAIEFERETRVSEGIHVVGIAMTLPLAIFAWKTGPIGLAVWSSLITLGDTGLALLQRAHRTRIWPVVSRVLTARAKRGARSQGA